MNTLIIQLSLATWNCVDSVLQNWIFEYLSISPQGFEKEDYSAWNTQWVQSRYFTAEVWTTSGIHLKIKAWKEKYLRLSIYIFQVLSTKKKLIL